MNRIERIEAAEKLFFTHFERGASEWEETFEWGCAFASRLCDCSGACQLCEDVIAWLEDAAANAEEDSKV